MEGEKAKSEETLPEACGLPASLREGEVLVYLIGAEVGAAGAVSFGFFDEERPHH